MNVVGIYRGSSHISTSRTRDAIKAYGVAQGFVDVGVIEVQTGDRMSLMEALNRLDPGDVAIILSLDELGDTPSAIASELQKLAARDIQVWSMDVGSVSDVQRILRPVLRLGEKVERELAEEKQKRIDAGEEWSSLFEQFRREVGAKLVSKFGTFALEGVDLDIPEEVVERMPLPETNLAGADFEAIGAFIKSERISRHYTQRQMAEQLGHHYQQSDRDARTPDTSAISRGESSGEGPHIWAMLEVLSPDVLPDETFQEVYGEEWPLYVTMMIRNKKARDAAIFAAEVEGYKAEEERSHGDHGNGASPDNPFEDATRLQAGIGDAAAEGLPPESRT